MLREFIPPCIQKKKAVSSECKAQEDATDIQQMFPNSYLQPFDSTDFMDCLPILLSLSIFTFIFLFPHFLVVGSARNRQLKKCKNRKKLTYVSY